MADVTNGIYTQLKTVHSNAKNQTADRIRQYTLNLPDTDKIK